MKQYNPNYVAYARAHGRSAEDQLAHDKARYTGGCMCGFILWISQQKAAFYKVHPECFCYSGISDLVKWEQFLTDQGEKGVVLVD